MKVQCDVCGREAATVLCCADEAALCAACDRRVHRANKLAGKHCRFSLLSPAAGGGGGGSSGAPLCDVCRERRALVFCVEDRAILCEECDDPIHSANDLTKKHSRFLLVGVRVTSAAPPDSSCSDHSGSASPESEIADADADAGKPGKDEAVVAGNSISEYLTKVCPGWRVEDLLVDDAAASAAAAASSSGKPEEQQLPFLEPDLDGAAGFGFLAEALPPPEMSMWVPHVPQGPPAAPSRPLCADVPSVAPAAATKAATAGHRHGRNCGDHDAFTVPQISPETNPRKRARPSFWYY